MYQSGIVLLLLLFSILLGGCAGARETDDVAFVLSEGIDATDNDEIEFTFRISAPRKLSSSPSGGNEQGETSEAITIRARNAAEARNLLKSAISRTPNQSHVQAIIIGEKLARKGVQKAMAFLMRYREFRGTVYIIVVHNMTAKDFMKQNQPKLEVLYTKYYDTMIRSFRDNAYYVRSRLDDFYIDLKNNSSSPVAVLMGINPGTLLEEQRTPSVPDQKNEDETAGFIRREGGNKAEALGSALFRKDKMVGILTMQETRVLSILQGTYKNSLVIVDDPLVKGQTCQVSARLGEAPRITVTFIDGHPVIDIKVFLEAEITSIPSGTNYEEEEYRTLLEQQVSNFFEEKIGNFMVKTQNLGCDPAGFGYYARRDFNYYKDFMAADWESLYSTARVKVAVKTSIRRMGLMRRTLPNK